MSEKTEIQTPIYSIDDRTSWDEMFMLVALSTATRSDDLFIKHGAVLIADNSKHIIGTGYNNTIRKMDLTVVQPENRDVRRPRMRHAERNCMDNATHKPFYLPCSTTMYITGLPCINCLEDMIGFGIQNIVYIDRDGTITEDEHTSTFRKQLLSIYKEKVFIRTISVQNQWVQKGLELLKFS